MKVVSNIGLDEVKTFSGPHDGVTGPVIRLPVQIKKVIDDLDGKTMPLQQAVDLIVQLVERTPGTLTVGWHEKFGHGSILLRVGHPGQGEHIWKLISFC